MKTYDRLIKMSIQELLFEIMNNTREVKRDHDTAVLMGSLGVSPKHMNMYFDSVKAIKNMKE